MSSVFKKINKKNRQNKSPSMAQTADGREPDCALQFRQKHTHHCTHVFISHLCLIQVTIYRLIKPCDYPAEAAWPQQSPLFSGFNSISATHGYTCLFSLLHWLKSFLFGIILLENHFVECVTSVTCPAASHHITSDLVLLSTSTVGLQWLTLIPPRPPPHPPPQKKKL